MLKIGDYVKTVEGVTLEETGEIVFEWGGKIEEINEEFAIILVRFDAVTINKLSDEYILTAEEKGEDWDAYNFSFDDLEKMEPRDTAADKEKAENRIAELINEDDDGDAYFKKTKIWEDEFHESELYQELTDTQKKSAGFIIDTFTQYLFSYFGYEHPKEWTVYALREVCLDIVPRKISSEPETFEAYGYVLIPFCRFLKSKELLPNSTEIIKCLDELKDRIPEEAANPNNWGMAKSMLTGAFNSGLDITDQNELDKYLIAQQIAAMSQFDNYQDSRQEPVKKSAIEKIGRNQKITVKYTDGKVLENVKFKKVDKDILGGKCEIIKF